MVSTTVSSNVPLDIGIELDREASKRNISVSQLIREILQEKYKKASD